MKILITIILTLLWALLLTATPIIFKEYQLHFNLSKDECIPMILALLILNIALFIGALFSWIDVYNKK